MRNKKILVSILCLLVVSVGVGAVFTYPPEPKTRPAKIYPRYLLCLRYWGYQWGGGIVLCNTGGTVTRTSDTSWDWTYLYEIYYSLDEVIDRLNSYTGGGLEDPNELVGLWKLDNNLADKLLRLDIKKCSEPKRIEERKWTEYKWKNSKEKL